jgi:hypothetical protein
LRAGQRPFVCVGNRPTAAGGPLEVTAVKPTLASAHWRPFVLLAYAAALQREQRVASTRFVVACPMNLQAGQPPLV